MDIPEPRVRSANWGNLVFFGMCFKSRRASWNSYRVKPVRVISRKNGLRTVSYTCQLTIRDDSRLIDYKSGKGFPKVDGPDNYAPDSQSEHNLIAAQNRVVKKMKRAERQRIQRRAEAAKR